MVIKYNGKVTDKGLHIYNRSAFDQDIKLFHSKEVTIKIERKKKSRSLDQNAFYWGVVIPLVREGLIDIGYKVGLNDSHELLKSKFAIKEHINEKTGEVLVSKQSTSTMTTTEFMGYIADIQQFASEYLNIEVPDPNEQLKFEI